MEPGSAWKRSSKGLCGLDGLPKAPAPTKTHLLLSNALDSRAVRVQACHKQWDMRWPPNSAYKESKRHPSRASSLTCH